MRSGGGARPGPVGGGGLTVVGFAAKAGVFPLHIWLPTAHPAAPAPASGVLSGVILKAGVFGILVVSTQLFRFQTLWGNLLLVLGLITMVLGAVLAPVLGGPQAHPACSSVSQIGFILVGIAMQCLLGEHGRAGRRGHYAASGQPCLHQAYPLPRRRCDLLLPAQL